MSINQISLDGDGRGKWEEKEQKRRHGLVDWFFRKVVSRDLLVYKGSRLKKL